MAASSRACSPTATWTSSSPPPGRRDQLTRWRRRTSPGLFGHHTQGAFWQQLLDEPVLAACRPFTSPVWSSNLAVQARILDGQAACSASAMRYARTSSAASRLTRFIRAMPPRRSSPPQWHADRAVAATDPLGGDSGFNSCQRVGVVRAIRWLRSARARIPQKDEHRRASRAALYFGAQEAHWARMSRSAVPAAEGDERAQATVLRPARRVHGVP